MILKKVFDDSTLMREIHNNKKIKRYILFIIGVFLHAFAFNVFILPSNLVYGVSGIAVILNKILLVPAAYTILVANLLLIIASLVYLGTNATRNTILGAVLYPLFIIITSPLVKYIDLGNTEPVIIALTGATIYGLGAGIIFKCGYTTGGTDIIKQIFAKITKTSIGQATIYAEGLIVTIGAFVFGWQTFIYSIVSIIIISYITDRVILGISSYKTFQIVTKHDKKIERFITNQMNHKATIINQKGLFQEAQKKLILCTIPTKEYYILKEAIKKIDDDVFFIVTDTYEVQGGK